MINKWRQQGAPKIKRKRGVQHEADAIRCVESGRSSMQQRRGD